MKQCGKCYFGTGPTCARITGLKIDKEQPACPLYKNGEGTHLCDCCGRVIMGVLTFDSGVILCEECSAAYNTCNTCANGIKCAFETDPSPISPVVIRTEKQGNMTIQCQIRNPERIAVTCAKGCSCFIDGECARVNGLCSKYNCFWR